MNLYGNNLFFALLVLLLFGLQAVLIKLHPGETEITERLISARVLDIAFGISISFAVASLFHLYPGNARTPIQDSSSFLYIGKRMTEGKLPYRDMFDHKGPLLYLIQYVGLQMTPGHYTGVWLLEVLNAFFTASILKKLADLVTDHDIESHLSVMAALGVCGWMVWQGGNFTEEYALPWISLAAYESFHFFRTGTYRNYDVLLLGSGFAVILLLRANMIAAWAVLMPIILVLLLKARRSAEIWKCTLFFVSGAAVVILPVVLWAAKEGFLLELWQDYILFNFQYTDGATGGMWERLSLTIRFMIVLWPATLAVLTSLFLSPKNRLLWYNLVFYLGSASTASMSGRLYYHYAIVMLPAAVLAFAICFSFSGRLFQREEKKRNPETALSLLVFCLMLLGTAGYRQVFSHQEEVDPITAFLQKNTQEQDDVLVIGNSSWYYLLADRKTNNRFFYQLPPMEISEELRSEFYNELRQKPPYCVVIPGYWEDRAWMNEALGDIRAYLEAGADIEYSHAIFDEFEIYQTVGGNHG